MTAIKSDSNPDKRNREKPDNYLENWIERQSLVESMIPIIGKFHREKNVRILLYGTPLISLSVIEIMQACMISITERDINGVPYNSIRTFFSLWNFPMMGIIDSTSDCLSIQFSR